MNIIHNYTSIYYQAYNEYILNSLEIRRIEKLCFILKVHFYNVYKMYFYMGN